MVTRRRDRLLRSHWRRRRSLIPQEQCDSEAFLALLTGNAAEGRPGRAGLGVTVEPLLTCRPDPANCSRLFSLFTFTHLSRGCLPGPTGIITVEFLSLSGLGPSLEIISKSIMIFGFKNIQQFPRSILKVRRHTLQKNSFSKIEN